MWYLYGVALLAGIANAIEPGQNGTLSRTLGNPLLAGLVCFGICALCFALPLVVLPGRRPKAEQIRSTPWWAWPGGVLGAVVVLAQLVAAESIGAAPFLGLVVTAGVVVSILLDHYGLVGFDIHRAGRWRMLGGALMVAGVTLVGLF